MCFMGLNLLSSTNKDKLNKVIVNLYNKTKYTVKDANILVNRCFYGYKCLNSTNKVNGTKLW